MNEVLNLYKRRSETPLQTTERYVKAHPEYAKSKMTYAGRLDPMAEGVLVVLVGEKNKEREAYTGLDKDYEFEFVLGVSTDTFDVLGKITDTKNVDDIKDKLSGKKLIDENAVKAALGKYLGKFEQKYPPYSSKVIDGTPLFVLARKGMLHEKEIPSHMVEVSNLEFMSSRTIEKDDLVEMIHKDVSAVSGDFRQKEILHGWTKYFTDKSPLGGFHPFTIYKARISCGSGFYVRQLISDIGRDLGTGAVTISIVRTRVGNFKLAESIK